MLLEGKIKTMLVGGPSKAGANAFDSAKGLIAAQASTSGPASGETCARYEALAWEGVLQSLSGAAGDNAADILAILASKYSAFRRTLVDKAPSTSQPLLSGVAVLASKWASYLAKRIAGADVCAVGAYDRALLTDPLAKSIVDGSSSRHSRPSARPSRRCTCARTPRSSASPQAAACSATRPWCTSTGRTGRSSPTWATEAWDGFCGNLLSMIGTNDQTHSKLAESVNLFITTDLRHVAGIVKGHFDFPSLDGKVEVSFGCDASQRILANADEASRMLGHHVLLWLVQLSPVMATGAPNPLAPASGKGARGGKLAQPTAASSPQDSDTPRIPQQLQTGGAGQGPPLPVSNNGDGVTTPKFKYDMKLLENAHNRPREKLCLEYLLRRNAKI
jgi:hypothetical protein